MAASTIGELFAPECLETLTHHFHSRIRSLLTAFGCGNRRARRDSGSCQPNDSQLVVSLTQTWRTSAIDAARLAHIDDFLHRYIDAQRMNGWQLAITRHGELVHAASGGLRDVEAGRPGVSVVVDPVKAKVPHSIGEYGWGGAASTAYWVDPVLDMTVVFMTQLMPSDTFPIRPQLRQLIKAAIIKP